MKTYTFRISLECPHCRTGIPVNGFAFEVLCQNCLKGISLPQEWWEGHLDPETVDNALDFEPGTGTSTSYLTGMKEKIESGNRPPRCQDCKTELSPELLQKAAPSGGLACPGCSKHISVRKATPLAITLIPDAEFLVHEDGIGEELDAKREKPEPVLFACLACGAGLPVDGESRAPKCTHCGRENYLPDSLWLRLHPAQVSHAFFITRNANAKPVPVKLENLKDDLTKEKAVRILKDETLDPAILNRIFEIHEDEEDVHTALAKHPRTPDNLLLKLAGPDIYNESRVEVAKRPQLPIKVIQALTEDMDSALKKVLLKRSDIYKLPQHILEPALDGMDLSDFGEAIESPDFPEWKLYDMSRDCSFEDAKRILHSPNASLRILKRLGNNRNSRPLIKEHPLYKELGALKRMFFF